MKDWELLHQNSLTILFGVVIYSCFGLLIKIAGGVSGAEAEAVLTLSQNISLKSKHIFLRIALRSVFFVILL